MSVSKGTSARLTLTGLSLHPVCVLLAANLSAGSGLGGRLGAGSAPARAVLLAAAPSAAAASRRISQAASLRPSALSAAGVFREGWAAACPAA